MTSYLLIVLVFSEWSLLYNACTNIIIYGFSYDYRYPWRPREQVSVFQEQDEEPGSQNKEPDIRDRDEQPGFSDQDLDLAQAAIYLDPYYPF